MPRLDHSSHETLLQAGYEYDAHLDKYFNRNPPQWDESEKTAAGIKQGAWPSRTIEEFRAQEREWIATQWSKILSMKTQE